MAVSTQSRKPERAEAQNSTRTQGIAAPREACLSVRLWTASSNSESLPSLWENESPAACLILDQIAASEGIPASRQGEVLTATFPTFQSAVFAARRLQWAVQGFSEAERLQATSLALLVHSPEEEHGKTIAEDVLHSLEQAAPGEILLTEKAGQPFDRLPGFPLQVASGDGLWELAWRAPESQSNRSYDEQILSQMIEQQGGQASPPERHEQQSAAEADYAGQAEADYTREPENARGSSRGKMIGIAVAALVVVGAVIFYFTQGKSNPAPASDQAQTQAQTQSQTEQQPAQAAQGGPALPSGPPARLTKQERAEAAAAAKAAKNPPKVEVKPPPVAPAPERERPAPRPAEPAPSRASSNSRCDLDPSQYSGLVDQAEKNQGRGKYAAAIQQFIAVLACDPGNARAKQGLERARNAAAAAEGGSQN
jgi:hypothetical protein